MNGDRPTTPFALAIASLALARAAVASPEQRTSFGQPFTPTDFPMSAARVRTVGHGGQFSTIQLAINAADDGDVILVQVGAYAGFTIDGKGVTVVEDRGHVVSCGAVVIRNVPAGSTAILQGLTIGTGIGSTAALTGTNNAGLVRVDACTCTASGPRTGAVFTNCTAVAINVSTFYGGTDATTGPRVGIAASSSQIALHDSFVYGQSGRWSTVSGMPVLLPPAPGVALDGGTLYVAGGAIHGGTGAFGFDGDCELGPQPTPGTQGAFGVLFSAGGAAVVLDASIAGGPGGDGGVGGDDCFAPNGEAGAAFSSPASVTTLPGSHRRIASIPPARERETLSLHTVGVPGDRVFLAFAPHAAHVADSTRSGARYVELPSRRTFLGTINGLGVLDTSMSVRELGPGADGVRWFAQAVMVDPAGAIWLGPAVHLTFLDASF